MDRRALFFFATLLVACGPPPCPHPSARCPVAPPAGFTQFRVTTVTGPTATSCDILFCWRLLSTGARTCVELDDPLADDFEAGETNVFTVSTGAAVAGGDLDAWWIENTARDCFFDANWRLAGVTVEAGTDGALTTIYGEPSITECAGELYGESTFEPMACPR